MSQPKKGYGQEAFGDPFGAGGFLHVVRVRAVLGQVVRVVYDEEPVHKSAVGANDALNPSNYVVSVDVGQAQQPVVVGVKPGMITGPAIAVQAGDERGFDVQTDRQLVTGVTYRVTAVNVMSKLGGTLGAPTSAPFQGIVLVQATNPPPRMMDLIDVTNDPFTGALVIEDSGDIAPEPEAKGLLKRILRRMATTKDAFAFLPGYGVGLRLKQPASARNLGTYQSDLQQQIRLEPEVQDASVQFQLANGVLRANVNVRTKTGGSLSFGTQHTPDRRITVL